MGILRSINDVFTLKVNLGKMRQKKEDKPLAIDIKQSNNPQTTVEGIDGDFIPLEITFFNKEPFAIIVTEIFLIAKGMGEIIIGDYNPELEVIEINPAHKLIFDDITIPPNFGTGSTLTIGIDGKSSPVDNNPVFLISRDTLITGINRIELEFTCRTNEPKDDEFKITAISQPLK